MRSRVVRFPWQSAPLAAALFLVLTPALGEQNDGLILIDGIAVITGSHTTNESDATAVLLSDVSFEATLVLATRYGPAGVLNTVTETDWRRAKRQAVFIRLLAEKARFLHEVASDADKAAIQDELTTLVGGEEAMAKILARLGQGFQDLSVFSETAALALTQLRYFEEQAEGPGIRRRQGRMRRTERVDDADAATEDTAGTTDSGTETVRVRGMRDLIKQQQTETQLRSWISELIKNGHVRMVR